MKKIFCAHIIMPFVLCCGCGKFFKHYGNVVPKVNFYIRAAERIVTLHAGSMPTKKYGECIYKKIIDHVEYVTFNRQSFIPVFIRVSISTYFVDGEKSSPYNYSGFVEYIKAGGFNKDIIHGYKNEEIINELQFLTTAFYDSCGQLCIHN